MHPVIMRQLAADHIRELITEAENAQRSRQARIQRRGQPTPLRRSAGPALSVVAVDALNRGPARLDADMHSVRSSRNVH
jgi:hypothetical protein